MYLKQGIEFIVKTVANEKLNAFLQQEYRKDAFYVDGRRVFRAQLQYSL